MRKHKPQHARKRHYHWQPWAKWLHLIAFTFAALIGTAQTGVIVTDFWKQLLIDLGITLGLYASFIIIGGFIFSMDENTK